MTKVLSELTHLELQRACDRTWANHYKHRKEQHRREMVERYGCEQPELNSYLVNVSLHDADLIVRARSEEEAEEIAETEIWINYESRQIEMFDHPTALAPSIIVNEIGDAAAAARPQPLIAAEAEPMDGEAMAEQY
jgi:hypothetical protein